MTPPDPRRVADAALIVGGIAIVMSVGFFAWAWLQLDNQWTPLGPFPTQEVVSDETYRWDQTDQLGNAQDIPAVDVNDPFVTVRGTKCYKEEVTVSGDVYWTTVDPPGGNRWNAGAGTAQRQPGCTRPDPPYENTIPSEVLAYVTAQDHPVVVAIGGCETPYDPDRGEGATLCWSTEPFALVP